MASGSPEPAHPVGVKNRVVAHDRQIFRLTLGRQHPIERIFVRPRQKPSPGSVFR